MTNPSRVASKGRDAVAGDSLRSDSAFMFANPPMAMGVTVANLATGGRFNVYTDRSAFEWALAGVLTTRITAGPASSVRAPSPR